MFWCSQGEWQRTMIYFGNANGTVRALGFIPESITHETHFETELSLRRFWAWFLASQFINWTDCSAMGIENFENIPLPCNEKEFDSGAGKSSPVSMRDRKRTDSFYAEMIRLCSIWYELLKLPFYLVTDNLKGLWFVGLPMMTSYKLTKDCGLFKR
jgi:hypothetical protein